MRGRPRLVTEDKAILRRYQSGESESSLARLLGIGRSTIHRRLVTFDADLRSAVEASDLRRHKKFEEAENLIELFDGLLLGDASIEVNQKSEGRLELTQRRAKVGWLEDVQTRLTEAGVKTKITDRGERGFQLRTKKYVNFTNLRKRWYPEGIKIVPVDVRLTPLSITHWLCGDGSLGNKGDRIVFYTDGFTWADVYFLAQRFQELYGIRPTVHKHNGKPKLNISKCEDRSKLVELVKPFCPECFLYKLQIKR